MIGAIRHIEMAMRIEGNAPWIMKLARGHAERADGFDGLVVDVKHLNAAVSEFADELASLIIEKDVVRVT